MKIAYGLSALLLGTSIAGYAFAADQSGEPPAQHPHFVHAHPDAAATSNTSPSSAAAPASGPPQQFGAHPQFHAHQNSNNPNVDANANASANTFAAQNSHGNWQGNQNNWHGGHNWNGQHGSNAQHWNFNLQNRNVAHFNPQDRAMWQNGHWQHGRRHGRDGWWWNTGGEWFFYDQPAYPYPAYASEYYYSDDANDEYEGSGSPDYATNPGNDGGYWYYCNNPAGYYPYVKSCHGPWRAVTPTPDKGQGYGPDANYDGNDSGSPQQYNDRDPRGRQFAGPQGDDRGPPPGYNDDRGPPPGYGDDRGPSPGYDNGQDDDDDDSGPPPQQRPY